MITVHTTKNTCSNSDVSLILNNPTINHLMNKTDIKKHSQLSSKQLKICLNDLFN